MNELTQAMTNLYLMGYITEEERILHKSERLEHIVQNSDFIVLFFDGFKIYYNTIDGFVSTYIFDEDRGIYGK